MNKIVRKTNLSEWVNVFTEQTLTAVRERQILLDLQIPERMAPLDSPLTGTAEQTVFAELFDAILSCNHAGEISIQFSLLTNKNSPSYQIVIEDTSLIAFNQHKLVEIKARSALLGWQIFYRYEQNIGAYFEITIPVKPVAEAKVLLVEDIPLNQQLVVNMLAVKPYELHVAGTGSAAINLLNHLEFDLILLDMQLPDLHGLDIAKHARSINSNIPIVAVTSKVGADDLKRYVKHGIAQVVSKPVKQERLEKAIEHAFAKSKSQQNEAASTDEVLFDTSRWQEIASVLSESRLIEELHRFSDRAEACEQRCRSALSAQDFSALEAELHAFASFTLQIGFNKVGQLCRKLESQPQQVGKVELDEMKQLVLLSWQAFMSSKPAQQFKCYFEDS